MTTVNFTQVLQDAKSASFEALPVGDYDVEVDKAESVTSSNGRPMIKVTFKVIVGPHTNRKIINNFVLVVDNPTALAIFFRNMKAMGLDDSFFASLGASGTLDPVANALVGRRARLKLKQREWNGEMRNDVDGVLPYTGAPGGMGGPVAGPQGLTGVPSPGPAAYGATPTPGPIANTPAQVTQQYAAVAAAVETPQAPAPAPAAPAEATTPATPAESSGTVAPPALPI